MAILFSDVKLEFFSKSKLESKKLIKTQNLFLIVLDYTWLCRARLCRDMTQLATGSQGRGFAVWPAASHGPWLARRLRRTRTHGRGHVPTTINIRDPSSMVKRVRISTFDFHSQFVDRRSVRSARIKRSEDLTCARSDSDSCLAATRRVRLTDAFTTVRLTPSISLPQ